MSTESLITVRNVLAGVYGATVSTLSMLVLVVASLLYPGAIEDGAIRGGLAIVGALLPIWIALFLYFLCISFKKIKTLKFALLVQTIWILVLSLLMGKLVLDHEGWELSIAISGMSFIILSVLIGLGSWACTRSK